jgi:cell division protein FtsB
MLDNDLIRLNQKLSVVLQLREQELQELRDKNRKLKRQIDDKNDGEKQ